jgi:hypothetical protein
LQIRAQQFRLAHRNGHDSDAEFLEHAMMLGHLDQVRLARDSGQVAQENQQSRPRHDLRKSNGGAVRAVQHNIRKCVADAGKQVTSPERLVRL